MHTVDVVVDVVGFLADNARAVVAAAATVCLQYYSITTTSYSPNSECPGIFLQYKFAIIIELFATYVKALGSMFLISI